MRHNHQVEAVAFFADGKTFASLGDYDGIRVWDMAGRQVRRLELKDWSTCLAVSPDGRTLAVNSSHDCFMVLDARTGKEQFRCVLESNEFARSLAYSPDGKLIASGSDKGEIRLWDAASGDLLQKFDTHTKTVYCVAFSPDGKTVASASWERAVQLWDVARHEKRELQAFRAKADRDKSSSGGAYCVAFSPDGKTLAVGNAGDFGEGTARLLDAATGELVREIDGYARERHIFSLSFSPDGNMLAAEGFDMPMRVWDVQTGKQLYDLGDDPGGCVSFSPDGKTLATGSVSARVHLWDMANGKDMPLPDGSDSEIESIDMSSDGRVVATRSRDSQVRLCDARTGRLLYSWKAPIGGFITNPAIRFLGDKRVVVGAADGDSVVVWEAATGRELHRRRFAEKDIDCFCVSPDGKTLCAATISKGKHLLKLSGLDGEDERQCLETSHEGWVQCTPDRIAFSRDGKSLVAGLGQDVYLLDVASGKVLQHCKHRRHLAAAVAFSPNGDLFASCEVEDMGRSGSRTSDYIFSKHIHVWEAGTGKEVIDLNGKEGDFSSLAFSPDGQAFAAAQRSGAIRFWETGTGLEVKRIEPDAGATVGIVFAPDGRTLASAHANGTALVWDLLPAEAKRTAPVSEEERERLWTALASRDAAEGYRAGWTLTNDAAGVVPMLSKRLRPTSAERLPCLIADLDAADFDRREAAHAELIRLGKQAGPALRQVVQETQSVEVRSQAQELLHRLESWADENPERLREERAVGVLERIGTAEAQAVLKALGEGAPEAPLTQQAKKALERVTQRPTVP